MALAALLSLIMRDAEAMAIRCLVIDLLHHTCIPLIVRGDFKNTPDGVTMQHICAATEIAYDRSVRNMALFNTYDMQRTRPWKKDGAYSHPHQGVPCVPDHILVSEEFMAAGCDSVGDVRKVDYSNVPLREKRGRTRPCFCARAAAPRLTRHHRHARASPRGFDKCRFRHAHRGFATGCTLTQAHASAQVTSP